MATRRSEDVIMEQNPSRQRVLFARIGWMKFYDGPQRDDERPIAGGRYTEGNLGYEVYTFHDVGGWCRGHFEPPGRAASAGNKRIRLERIDPDATGEELSGVLVVFVARRPSGGQVVVGWYEDATVYRTLQPAEAPDIKNYGYYCRTRKANAVLLPPQERRWEIPKEGRTFGQSNVCYSLDRNGNDKVLPWQHELVNSVQEFSGENLFGNPAAEEEEIIEARSGGQGYRLTPAQRQSVEMHAMKAAKAYFRSEGYTPEDTHKTKPYDLVCRRNGETWYVEVKGTTSEGKQVFLTKNEVQHAKEDPDSSVLFLLAEIKLDQATGKASGGHSRILQPWCPSDNALTPLQYSYDVPDDEE